MHLRWNSVNISAWRLTPPLRRASEEAFLFRIIQDFPQSFQEGSFLRRRPGPVHHIDAIRFSFHVEEVWTRALNLKFKYRTGVGRLPIAGVGAGLRARCHWLGFRWRIAIVESRSAVIHYIQGVFKSAIHPPHFRPWIGIVTNGRFPKGKFMYVYKFVEMLWAITYVLIGMRGDHS